MEAPVKIKFLREDDGHLHNTQTGDLWQGTANALNVADN